MGKGQLKLQMYENGWKKEKETLCCLYCEQKFTLGEIYSMDEKLVTAEKAIRNHLEKEHAGALAALLSQSKEQLGITQTQKEILILFAQKLSDTVIAQRLEISTSTVRNQRFKLKEKERQAYQFLGAMSLLDEGEEWQMHSGAKMIDERYQISKEEREHVIATYFDNQGRIKQFPSKEKRKIIMLSKISDCFDLKKNYSERAVNELLQTMVEDYVTIRRYLIEYGFFKRTKDGSSYWRQG